MKEYKITEEQIKEVHKWLKAEFKEPFEFLFPECFKSKLEVGRWYKYSIGNRSRGICYIGNEIVCNTYIGYGINEKGDWVDNFTHFDYYNYTPATESEVFEMLKRESEKRGFMAGVSVVCAQDGTIWKLQRDVTYDSRDNSLTDGSGAFWFWQGKWATIVETPREMTLEEIEKQLGHKVKIVS